MRNLLKQTVADQRGATSVEYGLLAGFIAVNLILGATTVGNALSSRFEAIAVAMTVDGLGGGTGGQAGGASEGGESSEAGGDGGTGGDAGFIAGDGDKDSGKGAAADDGDKASADDGDKASAAKDGEDDEDDDKGNGKGNNGVGLGNGGPNGENPNAGGVNGRGRSG